MTYPAKKVRGGDGKRKATVNKKQKEKLSGLDLKQINPMTYAQREVFEMFPENHMLLHGVAGTGKTFCAVFLALKEILDYGAYQKLVIVRSAVPTRDVGFLPGNLEEKTALYEIPYRDIVAHLFGRGDAYDILKNKHVIEFMSTSFVRGLTIDDAVVIVDEAQNLTFHEIDSVVTRLGERSKLVVAGDFRQSDLCKDRDREGFATFLSILNKLPKVGSVEFQIADIVRGSFVKSYIVQKTEMGIV